jgi:hypothetical protein
MPHNLNSILFLLTLLFLSACKKQHLPISRQNGQDQPIDITYSKKSKRYNA